MAGGGVGVLMKERTSIRCKQQECSNEGEIIVERSTDASDRWPTEL